MKKGRLTERETFHMEIPADENNLSEVRDFIAEICTKAGFSKSEMNNTKLAVDEACTNIIKHAYKEKSGDIRIDVQAERGKVEINIFDRGEPFDWSQVKEPDLNLYVEMGKKGGLGIYLMNRLMDSLSYTPSPGGNKLYMMKTSAGAAAAQPLFTSLIRPRWTSTLRFKFGMRATLGLLGLIVFLWSILFYRQTRELEEQVVQAYDQQKSVAALVAGMSESALSGDQLSVEKTKLSEYLVDRVARSRQIKYIEVIDASGIIEASSRIEDLLGQYRPPAGFETIGIDGKSRTFRDGQIGLVTEIHQPVYAAGADKAKAAPIGRVVMGVEDAVIREDIRDTRPMMTLLLVGVFFAGTALLYLLVSVFVKPIQALTEGVRAIGDGSFTDEIKITGPKEIGEIARAFNEITAKFREAQKNVVEQERLQKEMQVAQEIQHTLLPKKVPEIGGYDIASYYKAAKEVGGDYYDFVRVDDETLGVVVADVSGKGVPGSLVMTMIRTALRMEARGNYAAAEVMARMNDFVTEDMKKGMFVTIFYAILDSKNRIISYASAGHNPMILYRAETDETYFLNPRGFPVGISLPDDTLFRRSIDVEKIKLKKDDMLVIYTDGVTEAMNAERGQYGEERLIQLIKESGRLSPKEFIDKLSESVKSFTGDQPQNDDITVVAIKEKLMADEVLYGIRRKLLDLVDVQHVPVAEACKMMKVSPSTYYRYKKRLVEQGERGLQDKTLRKEYEIKRVSLEQRKRLLEIIKANPRYGAKKIAAVFNEGKAEGDLLTPAIVYDELKRIRLNTYDMRLEYLRRNRIITDEQFKEMVVARPRMEAEAGAAAASPEPDAGLPPSAREGVARAERPVRPLRPALAHPGPEPFGLPARSASGEARAIEVAAEELPGKVLVLRVKGHLDSSSAGELEGMLERIYEHGYRKMVVDLKNVTYISSGGWGIFTGRVKVLREGEGDVVLAGMSPEVYDIYELLGFQQIIMQFAGVDEAVSYISQPFETRQARFEETASKAAGLKQFEVKQGVSAGGQESFELAGTESPWTALKIEAGTVGDQGEITILYLDGVIDTVSSIKLRSVMDQLIDRGSVKLVVDLSKIEYVSSSGWGAFAARIKDIREKGGDIKIFGMDQEVDHIFHLLGFDAIMRAFGVLGEAIEDFKRPLAPDLGDEDFYVTEQYNRGEPLAGSGAAVQQATQVSPDLKVALVRVQPGPRGTTVVDVDGTVDSSTSERLEAVLDSCVDERPASVIVDLSDLGYMSSSGWGMLVKCMQRLGDAGGKLAIAGMSSTILKIFRDLGFEPLIQHYPTLERALGKGVPVDQLEKTAQRAPERPPQPPRETARRAAPPAGKQEGSPEEADIASAILGKPDVGPLEPLKTVKGDEKVIFIDFKRRKDVRANTDKRIKKLGWAEYGKKLSEADKSAKDRKKER